MLTVRFPNGVAVQYNTANHLVYTTSGSELYTDSKKTTWVASIQASSGAIVEAVPACRVYHPLQEHTNEKIEALAKEVRSMKRKLGK